MRLLETGESLANRTLGGDYPYWFLTNDGRVAHSLAADEAVSAFPEDQRELDPVAVVSMLCFGWICLDRTLIKGLNRTPWMGEVDSEGKISYIHAPNHGSRIAEAKDLARELLDGLRDEIASICKGHERVWCLLSGGMDSRIAAGVIRDLQNSGRITASVRAVTWGEEGCRDVEYARRMAERLEWEWTHVPISSEDYWNNLENDARYLGAEIAPCHLHRMDWFRNIPAGDVVIAASYGDSVGRAEYSGTHVSKLPGLKPFERHSFVRAGLLDQIVPHLEEDIMEIRTRYGDRSEMGWREIELQAHYMRRLISHVLGLINRWGQLKQVLVDQSVFGLMWDHAPQVRTNDVYAHLLRMLDPELIKVPWARTGVPFVDADGAQPDALSKDFHHYGLWLKRDHADKLEHLLFETELGKLGLFDMAQVRWMFKDWKRLPTEKRTGLGDRLSWLATLALFVRLYNVHGTSMPVGLFQIPINLARRSYCRALQTRIRLLKPDCS